MKRKRLLIASFASVVLVCCGLASCLAARESGNEREPTAVSLATAEEIAEEITEVPVEAIVEEDEVTEAAEDVPPTESSADTPTISPTETLIPTTRPTNTAMPTATTMPQVKVNVSSANLRSGPGANYETAGTARVDDVLFVIATNAAGDWYNVILADGERAWIAASVTEKVGSFRVDAAQTVPAPPTLAVVIPTNTAVPAVTNTAAPIPTNTQAPLPTAPLPTEPPAPTQPSAPGGCSCSGDTLNCGDFGTHAAAQACFNYCVAQGAGDIHRLDADNDGNACESLP